jgi:hypothetical protein
MGVDVNPAGENVLVRGIDQAFAVLAGQAGSKRNHPPGFNRDISLIRVDGGDNSAVCNDGVEPH